MHDVVAVIILCTRMTTDMMEYCCLRIKMETYLALLLVLFACCIQADRSSIVVVDRIISNSSIAYKKKRTVDHYTYEVYSSSTHKTRYMMILIYGMHA